MFVENLFILLDHLLMSSAKVEGLKKMRQVANLVEAMNEDQ